MRILIAEDDDSLGKFLKEGLQSESYTVDVFNDGEQARVAANQSEYDLVILDLNLPTLDGVSVLRQLRISKPSLPILVLTQRTKVEDKVHCLDRGADDYVGKPFAFSELSARVRALVRRSRLPSESLLTIADLKLDRVQRMVERAGKRIDLTSKEFALLEYLVRNAGRRVTRSMILEHVWNLTFDTSTNVVDVYASAQVDQRKIGKLAMAIQEAFQELGVFPASDVKGPVILDQLPVRKLESLEAAKQGPIKSVSPTFDSDGDEANLITLQQELQQALQAEIANHSVALHREAEGLVISLREFGFFDSGSVALRQSALPALDRIASILSVRTCRLRIEGHTDDVPIHTSQIASNWELSTARATELVRLLIVRYRFPPERLSAAGYAQYHPIASNATVDGRAQNRRVDLVILGGRFLQASQQAADSKDPATK